MHRAMRSGVDHDGADGTPSIASSRWPGPSTSVTSAATRTRDGRVTRWGTLFRSDTLHELHRADVDRAAGRWDWPPSSTCAPRGARAHRTGPPGARTDRSTTTSRSSGTDRGGRPWPRRLPPARTCPSATSGTSTSVGSPWSTPWTSWCRSGQLSAGVPLCGGQGPHRGAGRAGPRHPGRGRRGHRRRLPASPPDGWTLILDRYRSDPAFAERMASVPASRFGVEAATMERFLAELDHRFGGARAWALASGVAPEALDRMEELLSSRPGEGAGPVWPIGAADRAHRAHRRQRWAAGCGLHWSCARRLVGTASWSVPSSWPCSSWAGWWSPASCSGGTAGASGGPSTRTGR